MPECRARRAPTTEGFRPLLGAETASRRWPRDGRRGERSWPTTRIRQSASASASGSTTTTWAGSTAARASALEVVIEQREEGGNNGFVWQLPTRIKYGNVKLTRPVGKDSAKLTTGCAASPAASSGKTAIITAMTGDRRRRRHLEPRRRHPGALDRPEPQPDSPKVAMETVELAHHGFLPTGGGGGQNDRARDRLDDLGRPGRPGQAGDAGAAGGKPVKGRPKMDKAQLTLYDPRPRRRRRRKPGAKRGAIDVPVQPQRSHDQQGGQVGAQAGQGREEGRSAASSPAPSRAS